MAWNEGYVADIDYPTAFFHQQSPSHLNFACVLNGVEPVPLDRPFTYCELGFGQGLTLNLLAASNPEGRFYGVDFMPTHVAGAREIAEAAQLDNVVLLENSFADLARGEVADLPQFDFVALHGVYTWVTAENRAHIVDFLSRYLKPGGIVYITYNAMPGWSAVLPLHRLVLEHADRYPAGSKAQLEQSRAFVRRLEEVQARYVTRNPTLRARLDSFNEFDNHYLAHEYLNRGWEPMYHADVARDLSAAKLDYVGSAELPMAFPHLYLSPEQEELVRSASDPVMRETARDYILNNSFRWDIFVRGARRMNKRRQRELFDRTSLAMQVSRESFLPELKWTLGTVKGTADIYLPIAQALSDKVLTLAEIASLPELKGTSIEQLAESVALLVASKQAGPVVRPSTLASTAAALRLNRVLAEKSCHDDRFQALASPVVGNGVVSGLVQRLVYLALQESPAAAEADPGTVVAKVAARLAEQGARLTETEASDDDEACEIARVVTAILERRVPVWRRLGML